MNWLRLPKKVYFKKGSMPVALKELRDVYECQRVFIVSDPNLYVNGNVDVVNDYIRDMGIRTAEFFTIDEVPTFENVRSVQQKLDEFLPDAIVAVGGGSVISVAKAMWLQYENPEKDIAELAAEHCEIKACSEEQLTDRKCKLVLISTIAGTGSEVSPFAVLRGDDGEMKLIASYELLAEISVTDADFSENMPKELTKKSALNALSQAIRAYLSEGATEYIQGFAKEAVKSILENIADAVNLGTSAPEARQNMANAAAISGMAVSNSMSTIETVYTLFPNTSEKKNLSKNAAKLAEIAKYAGLEGKTDSELTDSLIKAINDAVAL